MSFGKKLLLILFGGAIIVSITLTAIAKDTSKKMIDYVALGDSLAAGTTPDNEKGLGYPDFLAESFEEKYKVNLANFAVPGYTSVQLENDVLNNQKVRDGIKGADYITIDIGGNDLLRSLSGDPKGGALPNAIAEVSSNIQNILQTIDGLNPSAKVYVMGYYNVYPYSSKEKQDALMPFLDELNSQIEKLSDDHGDTFVPTYDAISKDYQTYLPNPSNIHLSLDGYQVLAEEFWKHIE